eukprot:9180372-Ditylum_brightwellii.AAC.1
MEKLNLTKDRSSFEYQDCGIAHDIHNPTTVYSNVAQGAVVELRTAVAHCMRVTNQPAEPSKHVAH